MSDDQFTKLSDQIANLDELITKLYQHTEAESAKLLQHMEREFASLHDELSRKADKDQVDRVYGLVDQQIKQQEVDEHERLAMNHQLDQHEHWIAKAAKQLGVSYER
jgi:uncharacterized protein YdcH (DUF465 family)